MTNQFPSICFIAPKAYPLLAGMDDVQLIGGAELQVVIVAKLLAERGRKVSMICLDFGQPQQIQIDGVNVLRAYRLDQGIPVLRFLWPRLARIWQCLKLANADIYYQQTAGVWTGVMAAFCRLHARKSIFAAASNPDLQPNTPRIRYSRDRWIYAFGLRNVDRIFVQNVEQAQLCKESLGRDSILVPNCYEAPAIRSAKAEDNCILWVSTIRQLKRPQLFLELAQAFPRLKFRMIGGPGDGEHALFDDIKARAGTISNLEFLGFLPFNQTEAQFDQATILVNTSESEGVPNAFLQAWARSIPTVSFVDAGARLEGTPVGVTTGSMQEMIASVAELIADEHKRLAEGRRGAEYVSRHHSPKSIVGLYERIFEDLMRDQGPPGPRSCARSASANTAATEQ